jgi:hypothetical protein
MMGPKKLSTIREELRQRLSRDGKDPIEWLQECIAKKPKPKDSGILESLLELLKDEPTKPQTKAKKPRPPNKR